METGTPVITVETNVSRGWYHSFLQPFLVVSVVTALILGPITVVSLIFEDPLFFILGLVALLVATMATLTTRWLSRPGLRISRLNYRLAEVIVILILMRLLSWAFAGNFPDLDAIKGYLLDPFSFLDGAFIIFALIALFAWERSTSFSSVFSKLHLSPGEIESITAVNADPYANRITGAAVTDRNRLLQGFFREWVMGGLVLGICAVLTTYQLSDVGQAVTGTINLRTISRLGLRPELLIALLIYFIGGLWLASLGRLEVMRARWLMEGITFDRQVTQRWQRYSVLLLALVALIAAFLPIGSTFAIARILQSIGALIVFIAAALFAILGAIYFLLTSLLSGATPDSAEEPFELVMPEFIQPPEPPPIDNTPALIFGTFFWAIIVVVSIVAILFFLRDRGIAINFGVFAQIWRRLALWLKNIWLGLTGQLKTISTTFLEALQPTGFAEKEKRSRWRFVRLNALSPRNKIRYFYLSTVRRAGQRGVERRKNLTPLEYSDDLKENWPHSGGDLDSLTAAFLRARYNPKEIKEEDIEPVKRNWKRIKSALRERKKRKNSD